MTRLNTRASRAVSSRLMVFLALVLHAAAAHSQTFAVDFSTAAGPPLIKTKFGVYQTPLTTLPRLLNSVPLLREINVADLRYEIGWGKPESLATSQISGTAAHPRYDFSTIDAFVSLLKQADVTPLLAMTYCPDPLKSRAEWAAWKDVPSNLDSWQTINEEYARHLRTTDGIKGSFYEVWNEPDIPDPGGKMFFTGTPQDYERLYARAETGIRHGDPNALVGGPAAAWNLAYLLPLLSHPLDFASIHAYDNYPTQINALRAALSQRPDLPIFLTEYASFTEFPPNGPQSRAPAATRFFRDVKGLLRYPDVTKVYWAQWLDAGNDPGMGLITASGHRKAIFNAFKIYGEMPVDRAAVTPDGLGDIDLMASSDEHVAGVTLWNNSRAARSVTVNLNHLPFSHGTLRLYRIDPEHASYIDNPASENLEALQTVACDRAANPSWSGSIPVDGVVFLKISDGKTATPPLKRRLGTHVRDHRWFFDRHSTAYSDFDAKTGIARVGMGDTDFGVAQIGAVIDDPAPRFRVHVTKSGSFRRWDSNSLLALRIDFQSNVGTYSKSVLFHAGLFDPLRDSKLPWARGGATPDLVVLRKEMNDGRPFDITPSRIAPPDWNHKRLIVTFVLQNAGRDSRAKFTLTPL